MIINRRLFDWAGITLAAIGLFFFIIATMTTVDIQFLDNAWYLNRSRLIWEGVLPDFYVYTLAYPALVGAFNPFTRDVILSGMLVNGLLLWLILAGAYTLAHQLYHSRRVAALAVLLLATNLSIYTTARLFWASLPFMAVTLWCVVIVVWAIRDRQMRSAALLGAVLGLALYTRIEGLIYALVLIPALGYISGGRQGVKLMFSAGLVWLALALPFVLNILDVRQNQDAQLSADVMGIVTLVNRVPVEWPVIERRLTDLLTGLLSHWPLSAWLVACAGVLWAAPRFRRAQVISAGFIGLNLLYTFLLAIWPYPIHIVYYLPFLALILAATFTQWSDWLGAWKPLLALPFIGVMLPGLIFAVQVVTSQSPFNYQESELMATGQALDEWLAKQGWAGKHIYTFCGEIVSFSREDFQIMYRLQYATGWDSPEQLIPWMRESGALLMLCGNYIDFPDWRTLMAEASPDGLTEIGRFQHYIFYQPEAVE